jgi:hypothetical protein
MAYRWISIQLSIAEIVQREKAQECQYKSRGVVVVGADSKLGHLADGILIQGYELAGEVWLWTIIVSGTDS